MDLTGLEHSAGAPRLPVRPALALACPAPRVGALLLALAAGGACARHEPPHVRVAHRSPPAAADPTPAPQPPSATVPTPPAPGADATAAPPVARTPDAGVARSIPAPTAAAGAPRTAPRPLHARTPVVLAAGRPVPIPATALRVTLLEHAYGHGVSPGGVARGVNHARLRFEDATGRVEEVAWDLDTRATASGRVFYLTGSRSEVLLYDLTDP